MHVHEVTEEHGPRILLKKAEPVSPPTEQELAEMATLATKEEIKSALEHAVAPGTMSAILLERFLPTGTMTMTGVDMAIAAAGSKTPRSVIRHNVNSGAIRHRGFSIEVLDIGHWALRQRRIEVLEEPDESLRKLHEQAASAAESDPQAKQLIAALRGRFSGMLLAELEGRIEGDGDLSALIAEVNERVLKAANLSIYQRRGPMIILGSSPTWNRDKIRVVSGNDDEEEDEPVAEPAQAAAAVSTQEPAAKTKSEPEPTPTQAQQLEEMAKALKEAEAATADKPEKKRWRNRYKTEIGRA